MNFAEKVLRFHGLNGQEIKSIEWFEGDILDIFLLENALEDITTVYHCAALVSYSRKDEKKLFETNEEGTKNLVNLCLTAGVKNLCHISSVAALGVEKEGPTTEKNHWQLAEKRSNYGLTKYLAEREVWRGGAEGLNIMVVNPSIILGPAKANQSSGQLLHLLKNGSAFYPTGGVGLVDVRDVSRICLEGMNQKIYGERFLLNAENLRYRDLLNKGFEAFRGKKPKYQLPDILLEVGWRVGSFLSLFGVNSLTKETAKSAQRVARYDSSKAQKQFGFRFIPVSSSLEWLKEFN
jgi:nucleoside-diphosphate-sugar epimerase